MDTNIILSLVAALAMIAVAAIAVIYFRRISPLQMRWFWAGAGLWLFAVILKIICAFLTNEAAFGLMFAKLPYPLYGPDQ